MPASAKLPASVFRPSKVLASTASGSARSPSVARRPSNGNIRPAQPSQKPQAPQPRQALSATAGYSTGARAELVRRLAAHSVSQARRTPQYSTDAGEAELQRRSELVAREAEHRLAGVKSITDITPAQEDALFGIYAGASPAYDPRMYVATPSLGAGTIRYPSADRTPSPTGSALADSPSSDRGSLGADVAQPQLTRNPQGSKNQNDSAAPAVVASPSAAMPVAAVPSAATTDQQVLAVLEPDQQAELVETWEEEDNLWSFIVDDLNQELDDAVDVALELLDQQSAGEPLPEAPGNEYGGQNLLLVPPQGN